jgi:hypothetical protein
MAIGQTVMINEPKPFSASPLTLTRVRVASGSGCGGNVGTICAFGFLTGTDGVRLTAVRAKIIGLHDPLPQSGIAPPPDAVRGAVSLGKYWCFLGGPAKEIPNAHCEAMPTGNNSQLAVWCQINDTAGTWIAGSTLFAGWCSSTTNCEGMASCPEEEFFRRPAQAARVVHTAPRQWQVDATAFARGGPFRNRWLLALRPRSCSALAWDNGGDAVAVPLVELRCRGVIASDWRLTFRHGDALVEFTLPAAEWNDLAANVFATVTECRGDGDGVPASVTVTPV